ncbi:MAG: phosphoribosyltransferase family protein [Candidatus ainarchaeum sp.]|nr:phosphoribosyltransferase family protein [Candidatus ainarchaeum sp.]
MFADRYDAGRQLAKALAKYKGKKGVLILAIPRGALQMGEVLHDELKAPLDIIVTKKIGHPMSEEYAIGAVGPGGEYVVSEGAADVPPEYIIRERKRLETLVEEKYRRYRGDRPKPDARGKIVILVDDGIATGSTLIAAIHVLRKQEPAKIVVAVPVAPPDGLARVKAEADEVVCLLVPQEFYAIGQFYEKFPQVEDGEAIAILKKCQ